MNRIFGIGLSRTGTTSLSHALQRVGINMVHCPNQKQLFDPNLQAASDIPVVIHYKELDKMYPNSKFIYTVRDLDSWLASAKQHFDRKNANSTRTWRSEKRKSWAKDNRIKVYGQVEFEPEAFTRAYYRHDADVKEYFKGRENDLLILDIVGGDPASKLYSFLNIKTDITEFPHSNKKK